MNATDAIDEFWRWWPAVQGGFIEGFKDGAKSELVESMNAHVRAVADGLDWEFGPGREAAHSLCLSGRGNVELRIVAERWLERAPAPDATWEFHSSRQSFGAKQLKLTLDETQIELDDIRFETELDEDRALIHLVVWHPSFSSLEENARVRVAFIALDTLLGEDGVERWIGNVEVASDPIEEGASPKELEEMVGELSEQSGADRWVLMKGAIGGKAVIVAVNRAVKRVDHWLLDTHVTAAIHLREPNAQGFPSKEELATLQDAEDALLADLGKTAVVIARETSGGVRKMHFHAIESGPVPDTIARWATRLGYRVDIEAERDPEWSALQRWG